MRMARVNVYLPDELAQEARAAGLNISRVAQEALSSSLAHSETDRWLDRLEHLPRADIPHGSVIEAIDEARAELGERASD
jgi:post-segregation antitoxin (ccd killing protein)